MKLLKTTGRGAAEARPVLAQLARRGESDVAEFSPVARRIVDAVRKGGDKALRKYAARLDGLLPQSPLQITAAMMEAAWNQTAGPVREALQVAAGNIRAFAERQLPRS